MPAPLVNGIATVSTSTLSAGSHVVEVEYAGTANWIGAKKVMGKALSL